MKNNNNLIPTNLNIQSHFLNHFFRLKSITQQQLEDQLFIISKNPSLELYHNCVTILNSSNLKDDNKVNTLLGLFWLANQYKNQINDLRNTMLSIIDIISVNAIWDKIHDEQRDYFFTCAYY